MLINVCRAYPLITGPSFSETELQLKRWDGTKWPSTYKTDRIHHSRRWNITFWDPKTYSRGGTWKNWYSTIRQILLYLFLKLAMKLTAVIIWGILLICFTQKCYQNSSGKCIYTEKLLWIFSVESNITYHLFTRYSIFIR